MLKAFLIEKEEDSRNESLYPYIQKSEVEIMGRTENVQEAFWRISEIQPNVVFIDLDFMETEGLNLGKQINRLKNRPLLIVASQNSDYIPDVIEQGAFDFILKPFENKRLNQVIQKLLNYNQLDRNNEVDNPTYFNYNHGPLPQDIKNEETIVRNKYTDKFIIKLLDRILVINTDEIIYIGTENRHVFVKTLEEKFIVDTPLYIIEEKLGPSFVRIHRSFIVNIYYITEIQPWFNGTYTLLFKDGSSTPVSRSHIKRIRKILEF